MQRSSYYAPTSRIQTLDAIRGICLFGILMMNIQTYTFLDSFKPTQIFELHMDKAATYFPFYFLLRLFFRGQFYTIYSFLFGLGFYLMLQKNTKLGLDGSRIFLRRLAILFLFGCIHAFVFWGGDVLHIYAVLGLPLIYFNKKKVSTLVKWIVALALCGILIETVKIVFFAPLPLVPAAGHVGISKEALSELSTFQHGSFLDILRWQRTEVMGIWSIAISHTMSGFEHCEIMFLVGLIAGKTAFFQRIPELRSRIKRVVLILLPFALALKAFASLNGVGVHFLAASQRPYESFLYSLASFIGVLLLAFVYIGTLTLIFSGKPSRVAIWIGNAGRLGLTNYLAQTLICMLIFYSYGLGLAGHLTLLQSYMAVLLIYIFQIVYSNIWLRYYRQGPMEALWRRLTYSSPQYRHDPH